jgi:copper(I)-binding protein
VENSLRKVRFAALLSIALASCGKPAPIEVQDAWTRDTIGSTANAAVFMTITATAGDRLIGASTPAARKIDLMTMVGGTRATEMKYVEGIDLPARRPLSLSPEGFHVWLTDLAEPLKAGQSVRLTLKFEHAGEKQISIPVLAPAAAAPMRSI